MWESSLQYLNIQCQSHCTVLDFNFSRANFQEKYSIWLVRNFCMFHTDVVKSSLLQSQKYSNTKLKLVTWQAGVQWNLTAEQPIPYCNNRNFGHYAVSLVTKPTAYQSPELSTSSDDRGKGENLLWYPRLHQHILWWGWRGGENACPKICLP